MPLRTTEVAECPSCEELFRLGDLDRVHTRDGDLIGRFVEKQSDEDVSDLIGHCPNCGEKIRNQHIA